MLSSETIATIKATIPLLETVRTDLTRHFYERMLSHHPELKDVFNMRHQETGKQPAALFEAVLAYAQNIENLETLLPAVERIAHKHTSFLIKPEQYEIVGHHLIETIRELAGEAATPEVLHAWTEAYQLLAQIFIKREDELYEQSQSANGGWRGARTFIVSKKVKESAQITSFYLEPADGKPVAAHQPGQYLGIKVKPPTSANQEIRQYSLSDAANGQYYRISVKRETASVNGVVSNHLHDNVMEGDKLEAMPPAGDFTMDVTRQNPVVLLSAGVGLTPLLSMLNTLLEGGHQAPVFWLHGCENGSNHAFSEDIARKSTEHDNLHSYVWYNAPEEKDEKKPYANGLMDLEALRSDINKPGTHFYFCGPIAFMKFVKETLEHWGVMEAYIHYEIFGPHSTL
ncbi:NO-inducible flavohemoprotein [Sansalvadorimonas verongulae]|uniref:NO-inducible flavohemoprotein n=1 Tax=Sansalvadorimonas verongulae TaxID=2172824 RepID=UPI0012BCC4BF|nr:NO-inducible flavohemoprotein [Sansalvadorimonas verongulae]MTI13739.1 NO-inducible flavohemoprotein [Sansalvadorimonas verongulae]